MDLVLLFALVRSVPGTIAGWFIARRRAAIAGAILGAILGPLLWIGGIFLLWPGA